MKQDATVELFYNNVWNDHSADVYTRDEISIVHSAQNEQRGPVPSEASLTFQGRDARMNPANLKSELYGLIGRQTPIRISIGTDVRFSGKVRSWKPRRAVGPDSDVETGRGDAWVLVKAAAVLGNLGTDPLRSAAHRSFVGIAPNDYVPHAYWPMEDGRDSDHFASALSGQSPMLPSGEISFAAESNLIGSEPLPTFSSGASAHASVPAYTASTKWVVMFTMLVPSEPAAKTTYVEFTVTGATETLWRIVVNPTFSPAVVDIETYNSAGTLVNTAQITQLNGGLDWEPSEEQFYGTWATYVIASESTGGSNVSHWSGLSIGPEMGITGHLPTTDGHGSITGINAYGGNGASFGHFAVYVDPAFNIFLGTGSAASNNSAGAQGWSGETAGARFERLCREEGITSTVVGTVADTQPMGPQGTGTMLAQLREIAATDNGMIHDTRSQYGLTMRTGRSIYNQSAALELDFDAAELGAPLEPDIDDFAAANDVTAIRTSNGSSARAVDEDGPLGVNAIGRKKIQVDVNPASDAALPSHANNHLILGTAEDPRYQKVTVDLDALPSLAVAASAVNVGDLLQVSNLPDDLAPGLSEMLSNGDTETIGSHRRTITFNTQPGAILSHVGQLDGGNEACLQTAGAQLGTAITAEQTSFSVATTSGPLFTTSPPTGAQIIVRDREVMTVTGVASAETDGFGRTVANGWGNADSGAAYVMDGGSASDYSVSGGFGRILSPTAGVLRYMKLPIVTAYINVTINVRYAIAAASGGGITSRLTWGTDLSNYYEAVLLLNTSGSMTLQLTKRLAGVGSTLVSPVTVDTNGANNIWWPQLERGPGGLVRATAYNLNGTGTPTVLTATDTDITDGQIIAVGNRRETGNTDSTLEVRWDTLIVSNPQRFTVSRGPGPSFAHAAGASVEVYRPLRLTL